MISPVRSRDRERQSVIAEVLRSEGLIEMVGFEPVVKE